MVANLDFQEAKSDYSGVEEEQQKSQEIEFQRVPDEDQQLFEQNLAGGVDSRRSTEMIKVGEEEVIARNESDEEFEREFKLQQQKEAEEEAERERAMEAERQLKEKMEAEAKAQAEAEAYAAAQAEAARLREEEMLKKAFEEEELRRKAEAEE